MILAHGRLLYFAWDKANPDHFGLWNILGRTLDLEKPDTAVAARQLSKTDSSNFAPALAVDADERVHLAAGKLKNGYTTLAHAVFSADLQKELQSVRWVCPELHAVGEVKFMLDGSGQLHLAWFDSPTNKQYSYHYTNRINKPNITPLQFAGVKVTNQRSSFLMSFVYIIAGPLIDMRVLIYILTGLFAGALMLFPYLGTIESLICTRVDTILNKYGVAMVFFLLFEFGVAYSLLTYATYGRYSDLLRQHGLFLYIAPLIACLLYSRVTGMRKTEAMYGLFLSYLWVFWFWVIMLTLNLPYMNFIVPPVI